MSNKFKSAYSMHTCKSHLSEIEENDSEDNPPEEAPSVLSHDVIEIDVDQVEITEAESVANIGCGPERLSSYIPMFSYYSSKQNSENLNK